MPGHTSSLYRLVFDALLDESVVRRLTLAVCLEFFTREQSSCKWRCFKRCCFILGSLSCTSLTFAMMLR